MKIHNIFIAKLGVDIQFYSAISSLFYNNMEYMLEKMAFSIAEENYKFSPVIEGVLYPEQIDHIAFLLKKYENSPTSDPKVSDYKSNNVELKKNPIPRKYEKNYCLFDQEKRVYYLIALNNGRIIDTNAAKAEKAILLEEWMES